MNTPDVYAPEAIGSPWKLLVTVTLMAAQRKEELRNTRFLAVRHRR
jgi:hypothetical protein